MQCAEGHTIGVEELQWLNGLFTARFAEQAYRLTSITTNQETGWFLGWMTRRSAEGAAGLSVARERPGAGKHH